MAPLEVIVQGGSLALLAYVLHHVVKNLTASVDRLGERVERLALFLLQRTGASPAEIEQVSRERSTT